MEAARAAGRKSLIRTRWLSILAAAAAIAIVASGGRYLWAKYLRVRTPGLIVLAGDCTTTNLAPWLKKELMGRYDVWCTSDFVDSRSLKTNLEDWILSKKPDVVIFSVGLTDTFHTKGIINVPLGEYEDNLRCVVKTLREKSRARLLWMPTVPAVRKQKNAELDTYNAAADRVMKEAGIEVYDRNSALKAAGIERLVSDDKIHPNSGAYCLMTKDLCRLLRRLN